MKQYEVTGMSCAACSARVERAVSTVPGVESCAVNLLTNSMGVEGTAAPDVVIAAVQAAGYGASLKGAKQDTVPKDPPPAHHFCGTAAGADVFLHGAYDVELAAAPLV